MQIILWILIPPLLLFGCALLIMWVPLPHPLPPPLGRVRTLMSAVVTSILGLGYLVGLAVYLVGSLSRASRALDDVLASQGLSSRGHALFGRHYDGLVRGRQVDVYWMPSHGLQPARLDVHVAARLEARAAVGRQRPLLDCTDCPPVSVDDLGLGHVQVYAQDPAWARSLLADPATQEALGRLTGTREAPGFVYLQPGRLWLRAHPSSQTTDATLLGWLEDLLALAEAAESVE